MATLLPLSVIRAFRRYTRLLRTQRRALILPLAVVGILLVGVFLLSGREAPATAAEGTGNGAAGTAKVEDDGKGGTKAPLADDPDLVPALGGDTASEGKPAGGKDSEAKPSTSKPAAGGADAPAKDPAKDPAKETGKEPARTDPAPRAAGAGAGEGSDSPPKPGTAQPSKPRPAAAAGRTPAHSATPAKKSYADESALQRQEAIKQAFLHSWRGYEKYAWGQDELKPVSNTGGNWLGLGATIVDSLDTMLIMGLNEEYQKARDWIDQSLSFDKNIDVSVFETIIRVLGGLETAYDLTYDKMYIAKAKDLADRLLHAFDTPTGLPMGQLNLVTFAKSCASWTGFSAVLAEVGTVQLEMRELSFHTGDPKYQEKADSIIRLIDSRNVADGLYPLFIDPNSGAFTTGSVSYGALGDSFYEYLLKTHLHSGKSEETKFYRRMYDVAIEGMAKHLIQKSDPSGYTYIAEWNGGRPVHKMDELACFAGGMLALGSTDAPQPERDFELAKGVTETCYKFWEAQPSGIAPENVYFQFGRDFTNGANYYLLRPETLESIFYMWRFTHDQRWRDMGWKIFEAIEKQCKTPSGYSGLREVSNPTPQKDDSMQSFFLAETLKYLYLLYSDDDLISFDEWVFNTEAHPLRIMSYEHGERNLHPPPVAPPLSPPSQSTPPAGSGLA